MSKEVKTQEPTKSNKKYIVLAIVVILAIIGIMSGNGKEDETATTTVATTEQAPVAEQVPVVEEKTAETEPAIARIDISTPLVNADEPQFEVYVDGSEEPEKQVAWMPNFGKQGYVLQDSNGSKDITIKVLNDADINIILKGRRDEKKGQLIEHWVDYTSLTINMDKILPQTKPIWYGKAFTHTINAKAGDEIKIHAEWQKPDTIPEE